MEGEFKYYKKFHRTVGKKVSDGNYGNIEGMGSLTITVGYDDPGEVKNIIGDLKKAVELDKFCFEYLADMEEYYISAQLKDVSEPDPEPQQEPKQNKQPESTEHYNSVEHYLEDIGFSRKDFDNGGFSYGRKEEDGNYCNISRDRDNTRWIMHKKKENINTGGGLES